MPQGPDADGRAATAGRADGSVLGAAGVLLPVVWCLWLLVWLVPSLLLAPRLDMPRLWMTRQTVPAALLAASALFLSAVWPFWPALAGRATTLRGREAVRWVARSALEFVVLVALAAPFALVAWSVGGCPVQVVPGVLVLAGLCVFGLGLRIAAAGMGPGAARWLMFGATLACVLPLALEYAAGEAMGVGFPWLLEASPVVGLIRAALDGWPEGSWPPIARLWLWPGVGVVLALVGRRESARRRPDAEA